MIGWTIHPTKKTFRGQEQTQRGDAELHSRVQYGRMPLKET